MPNRSGTKTISNTTGVFGLPAEADATLVSDGLAVGFENMDRILADAAVTTGTGNLKLSYFTAPYADFGTTVRSATSGTAAATVTLIRNGLYTVDFATGNLTLVASTANDTAQYGSTNTMYTKSWTTPYTFIPGQRYAIGVLFVGTTAPTLAGRQPGGGFAAEMGLTPRLSAQLAAQADLPATVTAASLTDIGGYIYFAFA